MEAYGYRDKIKLVHILKTLNSWNCLLDILPKNSRLRNFSPICISNNYVKIENPSFIMNTELPSPNMLYHSRRVTSHKLVCKEDFEIPGCCKRFQKTTNIQKKGRTRSDAASIEETEEDAPVPLIAEVKNNFVSFFPLFRCLSTINKITNQKPCVRTSLSFPITSSESTLSTWEIGMVECVTLKNVLMR